jgi:hypothetical protein
MNRREFIGALSAIPLVAVVQPKPVLALSAGKFSPIADALNAASLHGSEAILRPIDMARLINDLPIHYLSPRQIMERGNP